MIYHFPFQSALSASSILIPTLVERIKPLIHFSANIIIKLIRQPARAEQPQKLEQLIHLASQQVASRRCYLWVVIMLRTRCTRSRSRSHAHMVRAMCVCVWVWVYDSPGNSAKCSQRSQHIASSVMKSHMDRPRAYDMDAKIERGDSWRGRCRGWDWSWGWGWGWGGHNRHFVRYFCSCVNRLAR